MLRPQDPTGVMLAAGIPYYVHREEEKEAEFRAEGNKYKHMNSCWRYTEIYI